MSTQPTQRPPITAADIKATGVDCWIQTFMSIPFQKLGDKGYTADEVMAAVRLYCYSGWGGGLGAYIRLRPEFDPEAQVCELCNDPGIVKQPQADGSWLCPQCKGDPTRAAYRKPANEEDDPDDDTNWDDDYDEDRY